MLLDCRHHIQESYTAELQHPRSTSKESPKVAGKGARTGGEAANHGPEALGDRGDGAGVGAIWRHAGVAVKECVPRHAHVVEPQLPVVHAVQARLGSSRQVRPQGDS